MKANKYTAVIMLSHFYESASALLGSDSKYVTWVTDIDEFSNISIWNAFQSSRAITNIIIIYSDFYQGNLFIKLMSDLDLMNGPFYYAFVWEKYCSILSFTEWKWKAKSQKIGSF